MYVTRNVSFHETVQYFGDASPLQGEKQDEANPLYQRMECTLDLDLHVNQNTANENESNKHATFDHEDQDTPYYDTKIDEDNNRESTTVGTENADETEPITINHSEVANATPNNTNIPDTPSSSVLQETNDTSQARYLTRSNRGVLKKQYQPDLKAKAKYPIGNYVSHHRLASPHALVVEKLSTVSILSNVHEAVKNEKWKKAMNEEMEALQKNQTWDVKLPQKKTVGCRWIYTVKLDSKGNIDRYKVRLVAKGYMQKYEIDYGDTFAPVAKMNTIRILISIAANQD
ncbi:putative RNA-directed DNA polymerase [Tanacetum coccineum]